MTVAWHEIYLTFVASVHSVGTACALAAVGIYLHRRGFVYGDGKRVLALISQQCTIPLFLFTKVVYCNQDWSDAPCPNVTSNLKDIWILMVWPAYVVGWGLLVGWLAAHLSKSSNKKAAMAACAFGNSTGLPITLLSVVHANFPATTELGSVDPTVFLSVYLLLYPILQWGVGGYLLAPDEGKEETLATPDFAVPQMNPPQDTLPNVLNNDVRELEYNLKRRGLSETDASLYISVVDLVDYHARAEAAQEDHLAATVANGDSIIEEAKENTDAEQATANQQLSARSLPVISKRFLTEEMPLLERQGSQIINENRSVCNYRHFHSLTATINKIASRCLQPPVIGAILGLIVAATPLRGIFVDIIDRGSHAPLQWFFDALYSVGQAAVPLNMMILGCNLSASQLQDTENQFLTNKSMLTIVVGKMLIMPAIGICSALLFDQYIWDIPKGIDAAFYLVIMIVFITPTANNVMVMVELSGSGAKESIAQVIAWQYAVSPLILSLTMTTVVGVASRWT
jgi:predicted permease